MRGPAVGSLESVLNKFMLASFDRPNIPESTFSAHALTICYRFCSQVMLNYWQPCCCTFDNRLQIEPQDKFSSFDQQCLPQSSKKSRASTMDFT